MSGFANVRSEWIDGDLYVYDKNGAEIFHIDGTNRRLVFHASAGLVAPLEIDATDIADGAVATAKIANAAVTTAKLEDAAVTSAKLASGAGVAALLTAGLGASASYTNTKNDTTDLLAGHATKARAVLIVVVVDEVMAAGTGTAPTFSVGEESGAVDKFVTAASLAGKAATTVQVYAGTQSANKKVQVTGTTKVGNGTGGITVSVIGIPTT